MTGMLWYSREPMKDRITAAMAYYEGKYGHKPDYCEVNPKELVDGEMPIEIAASKYILPYHIWVGRKR